MRTFNRAAGRDRAAPLAAVQTSATFQPNECCEVAILQRGISSSRADHPEKSAPMLSAIIVNIVRACCRFSWLVVALAVLATGGAGYYAKEHFAISTDTGQLISAHLPWRQREIQYDAAFPQQSDTIVVVVDAATPELATDASHRLTAALASRTDHIQWVRQPDAGPFFERNGLLFLSTAEITETTEQLIRSQAFLATLASDPTLRGFARSLAFIPQGVKAGRIELDAFAKPMDRIASALEAQLAGREAAFSWSELMTGEAPSRQELRRFIIVKPKLDYASLEPGAAASDDIRATAQSLGLGEANGVTVRLTGSVPMADEEFATLADGAALNGALTVAAVILVLWLALRSARIIIAVLLSLFVGLALTAAVGLAMVGALNLISVAFAVLFVGIGVDFGIQLAVRYRQERHSLGDLRAAITTAAGGVGMPLALAAAATAAGFYAFLPTDYRGVSELGLIAGTGMLIAFFISITLLPALLMIFKPPGEAHEVGYRSLEPVDEFLARHRRAVLVVTGLAVAAGLPLLQHVRFDFNPLNLRSAEVESVATMLDLMQDPDTSPHAANVLAPSLADANALAERLDKLPEVSRTLTLQSFVPAQQDEKLAIISDAAMLLAPTLNPAEKKPAPSDAETVAALQEASDAFVEARGRGKGAVLALRMATALAGLAAIEPERRLAIGRDLMRGFATRLDQIRNALQPQPVTIASLPPELARDWVAADGRARVEVALKGDANDNATLQRFVRAVASVTPEATGDPVLIQESADAVVKAFLQAAAFALLSITIILFLALRRITDVLVTLVPLLLACVVTMELTVLLDLPLNFANIIALPLLLGVGVAFKIYYVLAWRNGVTHLLASSLTRAVMFSAMTTAAAFGSLWFSNHPGTSSMGELLSLSLLTTLAAAVLFQPILMGPPRKKEPKAAVERQAERAAAEA
jgi:hopanoid biosynthesis associated RND transporter like protein HpnN